MEDPMLSQHVRAAVDASGLVAPEKAEAVALALASDFKLEVVGNRLELKALSGQPVERQLEHMMMRPDFAPFRKVPLSAGEATIASVRHARDSAKPDGTGPLQGYRLGGGGRRNSLTVPGGTVIPGVTY